MALLCLGTLSVFPALWRNRPTALQAGILKSCSSPQCPHPTGATQSEGKALIHHEWLWMVFLLSLAILCAILFPTLWRNWPITLQAGTLKSCSGPTGAAQSEGKVLMCREWLWMVALPSLGILCAALFPALWRNCPTALQGGFAAAGPWCLRPTGATRSEGKALIRRERLWMAWEPASAACAWEGCWSRRLAFPELADSWGAGGCVQAGGGGWAQHGSLQAHPNTQSLCLS